MYMPRVEARNAPRVGTPFALHRLDARLIIVLPCVDLLSQRPVRIFVRRAVHLPLFSLQQRCRVLSNSVDHRRSSR
jgi:hypothetical protein